MSCVLDTNIWLYAFLEGQDPKKSMTAKELIIDKDPVLSVQIINEVCVNLIRKAKIPEDQIRAITAAFYDKYPVFRHDLGVLTTASELREEYALSYWDSLILATALHNDVPTIYSEDMQNGLILRKKLEIVDPFKGEDTELGEGAE